MKLEQVTKRDVSYVELQRDKKHSLGFTIRDGNEEESRSIVKNVAINGPAAKSFAVARGDVVLSVNGCSTIGKRCKEIRRMLDDAGSDVKLQVLYKTYETRIQGSCVYRKKRLNLRLQKIKGSFGFHLRKCSKYSFIMEYPVISNIQEGSPIHKSGHLQDGDRLLMIDNVSLSWMSSSYIASFLQTTDEAEFSFEYSVGEVNFSERDGKLDLEIDAPIADLGIRFHKDSFIMYISSIQQGSVAERCGIFSEGDIVLSINDIDVKNLTVSRANFLLKNSKRSRKISFMSERRNKYKTVNENTGLLSSTDNTSTADSFTSDIQESNWRHFNTPEKSNFTFQGHQKHNFGCTEQIESIDKLENVLSVLSSLKQTLSVLTSQPFKKTQIPLDQTCTSCNSTKHAVKLCTSCVAKMNVKCAQSMDLIRELVIHFVKCSLNMFDENDDKPLNASLKKVIQSLRENLPSFLRDPKLQEHLAILAEKIASSDTSCSICKSEVKNILIIVKQLLLVLSVKDSGVEVTDLINNLLSCLLEMKFPCFVESKSISHSNDAVKCSSTFENRSDIISIGIDEELLSETASSHLKKNSETESNQISLGSNLNITQTVKFHDYLKLTHIQSLSESKNFTSPDSVTSSNSLGKTHSGNNVFPKEIAPERRTVSFLSRNCSTENKVKKFIKNLKFPKIWRSMDSLVQLQRPPDLQSINQPIKTQCGIDTVRLNQNSCNQSSNKNGDPKLNQKVNRPAFGKIKTSPGTKNQSSSCLLSNQHETSFSTNGINSSAINNQTERSNQLKENIIHSESTSSSSMYAAETRSYVEVKKTSPETMKLTLRKDGDRNFGLGISAKIASELPVIESIQPKSPAHRAGVLKLGDRILAINGIRVCRLSSREFYILKKESFAADTIHFIVEFDVCDEKYLFGSFDVVLDRTLKIGLIFEELQKSSPLVISGIVRGSGAHRCGEIFVGDEVMFCKLAKTEEFDPLTGDYNKEDNVIFTVVRDLRKVLGLNDNPHNPFQCHVNPCFHHEDSRLQIERSFDVKKTAVHSSRKNSIVVEHEVTLYRDSLTCDFGILLGKDRSTGRAFIYDMRPDGPAHKAGVIKKFDRIMKVNGVLVDSNIENHVLILFCQAGVKVDLHIRRIYREELHEI